MDFKQKQSELGPAITGAFADRTDLTADLAYLRIDTRATASLNGYRSREKLQGQCRARHCSALRGQPSAMTEAWAKAGYFSSSDFDDSYVANVGGLIKFNRNLSIVGEVEVMRHSKPLHVGLRASF